VAVYLILEDVWYIIPAKYIRGQWAVWLCPNLSNATYEPYREAWHLLRGESAKSGRVRTIHACAKEWIIPPFPVPGPNDERSHILLSGM
jgi:hypothetical protein